MARIWRGLTGPSSYDYRRLIDERTVDGLRASAVSIVCDIDKTYLETEFESVLKMARIAFEDASEKITVQGASEVLLAARWGDMNQVDGEFPRSLHFVSSSPPQLRGVLEEKLALDGMDWTSDTFKNQAYNILQGRVDLLRQHVAYKSAAILELLEQAGPEGRFYLIGDNAESDTYIYVGVALYAAKRLSVNGYQRYLELAGVEPPVASGLSRSVAGLRPAKVEGILIRRVPGYDLVAMPPLTHGVQSFGTFFEAALILADAGVVPVACLWPIARRFHNHYGFSRRELCTLLRRFAAGLPQNSPLHASLRDIEERLGGAALLPAQGPADPCPQLVPSWHSLTEDDILRHAEVWTQRLKVAREARKAPRK